MADDEDMALVRSGSRDLGKVDLRNADLSGHDFFGADLSGAKLDRSRFNKANLAAANLRDASIVGADFSGADLRGAKLPRTAVAVKFTNVILTGTRVLLRGSRIDFSRADLTGADFTGSHFEADVLFDGVQTDQTTNFDGVEMLRATSRYPAFSDYDYEQGKLIRRKNSLPVSPPMAGTASQTQATSRTIDARSEELRSELSGQLDRIEEVLSAYQTHSPRDHNNPPELVDDEPLPEIARQEITEAVSALRAEARAEKPSSSIIAARASTLRRAAAAIGTWIARKADIAVNAVVGSGAVAGVVWAYHNPAVLQTALLEASATASEWAHYLASKW